MKKRGLNPRTVFDLQMLERIRKQTFPIELPEWNSALLVP
jgi:hypothetical protein